MTKPASLESPIVWRKSVRSANNTGQCVEVGSWRKSMRSSSSGDVNCVEAGTCTCHGIAIRDSKQAHGPVLTITPAEWSSLLTVVKTNSLI